MTTEHRTPSTALDWGPLRENVERVGWSTTPIQHRWRPSATRSPSVETTTYERGVAGVRHLSQRAGNVARGGSAPHRNLSHRCRRLAVAIIQCYLWRSKVRSFAVATSDVDVDTRVTRLWCFVDLKNGLVDNLIVITYWNTVIIKALINPGFGCFCITCDSDIWIFKISNSEVTAKGLLSILFNWIMDKT